MQFYPSDWRAEPTLKLVSRAARSLWIDILGLMHDAGSHRLETGGRPMTERDMADILGDNPRTIKALLNELLNAGVCDRDEGSFIVSRRLKKDRMKRERDTNNGQKGGNPALKSTAKAPEGVNPPVKAIPDTIYHIPKEEEEREESFVTTARSEILAPGVGENPPPGSKNRAPKTDNPARPKARLPEDWHPGSEGIDYATRHLDQELIPDEITEFRAYWRDRTDRDGAKSAEGWTACWQSHCRRHTARPTGATRNTRRSSGLNDLHAGFAQAARKP